MAGAGGSGGVGSRRELRERALSLLYELEVKAVTPEELIAELPLDPEPFVADILRGVGAELGTIDGLITRFAIGWDLERMPAVDRNVLRMGVHELRAHPDTPVAAIVSEAVEVAKRYSTEESGRFVHGVLANIAVELRPGEAR